jgi:hypothetical protein
MAEPHAGRRGVADADLDQLLKHALIVARDLLRGVGGFRAFGATLSLSGVPALVVVADRDALEGAVYAEALAQALARDARSMHLRAVAICCADPARDLAAESLAEPALLVRLEHRMGNAIDVAVPYGKGWFGRVKLGRPVSSAGTLKVFAARAV